MTVTLARHAMATRFEMILEGSRPAGLRAAGEEALDEIERLEARLSLFRETSEIAQVNACAARRPVRVSPEVFELLSLARDLHRQTGGVFDVTIAPLMRCWGFQSGTGQVPAPAALARARDCVGMQHVHLDPGEYTVSFGRAGMMLDLGAIGKGYAIDRAVDILRSCEVGSALVHAGTSTVFAIGAREDGSAWKLGLDEPAEPGVVAERRSMATIELRDEALSVSGLDQKFFRAEGRTWGHVIDPRTGEPAAEIVMSAVILPEATETDALSTALLVAAFGDAETVLRARPSMRALLADTGPEGPRVLAHGIELCAGFRVKSPFEKRTPKV